MRRLGSASIAATCAACFTVALGVTAHSTVRHGAGPSAETVAARHFVKSYARPAAVPYPADNEYTPAREALGKSLFFDPRLSGSGWISCASCHNPGLSWGDGLPRGIGNGMQPLGRRTPTILNVAWADTLFWDGRAGSLEEQALGPIQAATEMNMSLDRLIAKIDEIPGYGELFAGAYPGEPVAPPTVARAIATFERQIVSAQGPFDRFAAGDDGAMSVEAQRGFALFNTKARCSLCHSSWRFTDDSFHDTGMSSPDLGRGVILPSIEVMQHAFKTPTLRNVARRAPYMHDGSIATLDEVVELYDRGGQTRRPSLTPEIRPLQLTAEEKRDLVTFLRALTSADTPIAIPTLPR